MSSGHASCLHRMQGRSNVRWQVTFKWCAPKPSICKQCNACWRSQSVYAGVTRRIKAILNMKVGASAHINLFDMHKWCIWNLDLAQSHSWMRIIPLNIGSVLRGVQNLAHFQQSMIECRPMGVALKIGGRMVEPYTHRRGYAGTIWNLLRASGTC